VLAHLWCSSSAAAAGLSAGGCDSDAHGAGWVVLTWMSVRACVCCVYACARGGDCVCTCSWGWLCMHVLVGVIVYACVSLIWLLACMQVCYCVYGSVRVSDCVQVRVLRGQASQNARAQIIVFYDKQVTISYRKKSNFKIRLYAFFILLLIPSGLVPGGLCLVFYDQRVTIWCFMIKELQLVFYDKWVTIWCGGMQIIMYSANLWGGLWAMYIACLNTVDRKVC